MRVLTLWSVVPLLICYLSTSTSYAKTVFADMHTQNMFFDLGYTFLRAKDYKRSEYCLRSAIVECDEISTVADFHKVTTLAFLKDCYLHLNQLDKASMCAKQIDKSKSQSKLKIIDMQANLNKSSEIDKYNEAIKFLKVMIQIRLTSDGNNYFRNDLSGFYSYLGYAYCKTGKYKRGSVYYRKSLSLLKTGDFLSNMRYCEIEEQLANCLAKCGETAKSIDLYKHAINLKIRTFPDTRFRTCRAYAALASLYDIQNNRQLADESYKNSVVGWESVSSEELVDLLTAQKLYKSFLEAEHRQKEADTINSQINDTQKNWKI